MNKTDMRQKMRDYEEIILSYDLDIYRIGNDNAELEADIVKRDNASLLVAAELYETQKQLAESHSDYQKLLEQASLWEKRALEAIEAVSIVKALENINFNCAIFKYPRLRKQWMIVNKDTEKAIADETMLEKAFQAAGLLEGV